MGEQPLAGVRVLELAQGVQGPYAGKLLADFGADVIKAEPPGGDVARAVGPFPDDRPDPEQSALFLHLNTNKRSIVLDPADDAGRELLRRLVADVDVVIESYAPGTLDGWGLGFEALRALRPALVLTSVTPFGQDGPYAGYEMEEIVAYAMGGPMQATGLAEREPVRLSANVIAYQCGTIAATATMGALLTAELHGEGVHVDVSQLEAQEGSIDRRMFTLTNHAYNGYVGERSPSQRVMPLPTGIYPVADGYVMIATTARWLPRMLATLQSPELNEAYGRPGWMVDPELPELLDAVLYPWLLERTKDEAMAEAQSHQWPITAVKAPVEAIEDPHVVHRGFMVDVDHPAAGTIRQPGPPFRMPDGWAVRRPAPLLGQHTEEICREVGCTEGEIAAAVGAGASAGGR